MKKLKTYLAWFAVAVGMTGALSSCQDDIDTPSANAPIATLEANISIFDLKQTFWKDDVNYIYGMEDKEDAEYVAIPTREDGSHYIIKGIVVSSDEAGNVFKNVVVQDETAAITLSINSYNLYLDYRMGQEVVIDITGMYVGKYNGLLQVGYPAWYANGKVWDASFMSPQMAKRHIELNGWPSAANIDTLTINKFSELSTTPEGLIRYQSRLVKFCDVSFTNGGKETFSTYHSSGVNQVLTDSEGNTLNVRTSGYSNFWNKTLPTGTGDVVCILSYYGTTGWQLILNDYQGCMGFGQTRPGSESTPYSVDQAIDTIKAGKTPKGWVYGYIVGAVAPEVTEVKSADDIEWSATPVLDNTLVIGLTADTKDLEQCLVLELPQGSKLQEYGNLVNNPGNYGKRIDVLGLLSTVMGTYGVADNSGAADSWKIEGVEISDGTIAAGDGSKEKPYNVAQVMAGTATGTGWVKGYIVGWVDGKALTEGAKFEVPATAASNILIAATADCKDVAQCVPVQLASGTTARSAVNLMDHPENLGKVLSICGSFEKYFTVNGLKAPTDYALEGGDNTPTPPVSSDPVSSLNESFEGAAIPTGWTQQQVAGDKAWYTPNYNGEYYAAMTGYLGKTPPFDQWLFTPAIDLSKCTSKVLTFDSQVNGYGSTTSKLEVYVLSAADANAKIAKLNPTLATAPASGYSGWVASGNLDMSSYSGIIYIGFRYYAESEANYATWCIDNVKLNAGESVDPTPDPDPTPTPTPSGDEKGDFNSFNGGEAKSNPYGTYTNASGWSAENAIILGGDDDSTKSSNPYFGFIGKTGVLAPTLNGRAGSAGKLTSPLFTDGCGTLTFNYGFAFNDSKCKFTINIKDANGNVVKTDTVTLDTLQQKSAYSYTLDVNVSGSFSIEIVNNCYSGNSSKNSDRVSIWNLTWTTK